MNVATRRARYFFPAYTGRMRDYYDGERSSDDVQPWSLTPTWRDRLTDHARHIFLGLGIVLVIVLGLASYLR